MLEKNLNFKQKAMGRMSVGGSAAVCHFIRRGRAGKDRFSALAQTMWTWAA